MKNIWNMIAKIFLNGINIFNQADNKEIVDLVMLLLHYLCLSLGYQFSKIKNAKRICKKIVRQNLFSFQFNM